MFDEGKFLSEMLVGPDHGVPGLMCCGSAAGLGMTGSAQTWPLVRGGGGPGLCHGEEIGDTTLATEETRQASL